MALRGSDDGRVGEAQSSGATSAEFTQRVSKEIGTGQKVHFLGIQQDIRYVQRRPMSASRKQYRHDFEKHVLNQHQSSEIASKQ